jgi:hypothetical protein
MFPRAKGGKLQWGQFLLGVMIGALAMNSFAAERADAIYRTGPETSLAKCSLVVVGRVSGLVREVSAKTAGEPVPTAWTARGQLVNLRAIKGRLTSDRIAIARNEQAMFAMSHLDEPGWTRAYGELIDGSVAVAFFDGATPDKPSLVVPSGTGEEDLRLLLSQIAHADALTDHQARIAVEAGWLTQAASEAERKAALRMLLRDQAPWQRVGTSIQAVWASSSPQLRQFFTGAAGFGLIEGIWPASDEHPVAFMCRAFMDADDRASTGMMLQLKQVLAWAERDGASDAEARIGARIKECYRQRLAKPLGPELKAYFDRLDPQFGLP